MVAKAGQLALVITDLQTLCNKAGAKQVHGGSKAKILKTAISQILTAFGNTKLAPLTRGQARRRNRRSDNYTYAITINEVEIEGYKKPDPFTQAVIKLLKPQAPSASDLQCRKCRWWQLRKTTCIAKSTVRHCFVGLQAI